jgi:hypothetical protein
MLPDGAHEEVTESTEITTALTAAAGDDKLVAPPKEWFTNPGLDQVTPITVTADGRIFGHIAPWDVEHTGLPGVRPPHSRHDYAFFKTGVVATAEGDDVPVGQLTLVGGHAAIQDTNGRPVTAGKAVAHYDDTASAVADLNVGEDEHGIWVSGGLRPGLTASQIRTLRGSAPSGDWRYINGGHELVAICQVNSPGFPVARAMVASGQMYALVAAGVTAMCEIRREHEIRALVASMEDRITKLEDQVRGKSPVTASSDATSTTGASAGATPTWPFTADIPMTARIQLTPVDQ